MRLKIFTAVLFALGFISSCAPGLSRKTEAFEKDHHGFTGMILLDAESGKELFQYNAHKAFTPASNTKILSLYAAIHFLDDSIHTFRYRNTEDSLIVSATGDPGLLNPEFSSSAALEFLRNSRDSIYYQKANWKQTAYGAGWSWDDLTYAFSPQISAIPVSENNLSFSQSNEGLFISPGIFQDSIIYSDVDRLKKLEGRNQFMVPQNIQKQDTFRVPFETSEELSIQILEQETGRSITMIPPGEKASKTIKSIASDSLYKQMMHQSDNLIAEQLLVMISEKLTDTMSTRIAIDQTRKMLLNDLPDEFQWADGSGLSRYNMNSPANLANILQRIWNKKTETWITAIFPTAGNDGTLADILTDENAFVFAKSGTLKNNYSLSGYLRTNSDRLLIFSIMNSNHLGSSKQIKAEISKLLIHIRNRY